MNIKTTLSLLLLVGVITTTFFTYSIVHKDIATQTAESTQNMDFFMRDVKYVETDTTGTPLHYLSSPLIKHYPDKDSYVFTAPRITTTDNRDNTWTLTAANGKTTQGINVIYLWNDVHIERQSDQKANHILNIKTQNAIFYPKLKYAITKDPITLTQAGSIVKSVGAKINFSDKSVELLSKIETTFENP